MQTERKKDTRTTSNNQRPFPTVRPTVCLFCNTRTRRSPSFEQPNQCIR